MESMNNDTYCTRRVSELLATPRYATAFLRRKRVYVCWWKAARKIRPAKRHFWRADSGPRSDAGCVFDFSYGIL